MGGYIMKKLICMVLISSIALSITACGGKKKEEAKSAVVEQKQIAEAAVALSNEPEEPEIVEYTCLPEMYEAELEDGLIQIGSVVFDSKKTQTLGEVRAMFSDPKYNIEIERASGTSPYTEEAIASKGEVIGLHVIENNTTICSFGFKNYDTSADLAPLDNCSYRKCFIQLNSAYPIWLANGISPFDLTYQELEATLGDDFTKNGTTGYWLDFDKYELIVAQTGETIYPYIHYGFVIDTSTAKVGQITFRTEFN